MEKTFENYLKHRKRLYGSVNGKLGNMITLSKSRLLKSNEKVIVGRLIENLKCLSEAVKENNKKKV